MKFFWLFVFGYLFNNTPNQVLVYYPSGNLWIDCFTDNEDWLYNRANVYDEKGEILFQGSFDNGYPIDSVIISYGSKYEVWIYQDSLNYKNEIFHKDTLYMTRYFVNGYHTQDIMYHNGQKIATNNIVNPKYIEPTRLKLVDLRVMTMKMLQDIEMERDINNNR